MIAKKLKELLDKHKVKYVSITHSRAFTAQEVAHSTHIAEAQMAKAVILNLGNDVFILAVIPANKKIDLNALKKITHQELRLASEQDFEDKFPDCEIGAMPPFGHLYDMKVYVDNSLKKDDEIGFNAGTHSELIKMRYKDFESLAKPIFGDFSE